MQYHVSFKSSAKRDMTSLPRGVIGRVDAQILALADDPRPRGSKKLQAVGALFRVRVGDYRILYEVDDANQVVRVASIKHRREAYRGKGG